MGFGAATPPQGEPKVVKMSYESFEKQFQWKTDPKTLKALEKMRAKELKEKANKIAKEAIKKIKEQQ